MPTTCPFNNDAKSSEEEKQSRFECLGVPRRWSTILAVSTDAGKRISQWTWMALVCLVSLGYVLTVLQAAQFHKEVRSIAGSSAATARLKDSLEGFAHSYISMENDALGGRTEAGWGFHQLVLACDAPRTQVVQGSGRLLSARFAHGRDPRSLEVGEKLVWLCRSRQQVRKVFDGIHGPDRANKVSFEAIMRDFISFEKLAIFVPLGPHPMVIATATHKQLTLWLVLLMAVFGSVLFMMRSLLDRRLKQADGSTDEPPGRPWSWFLFRPLLGAMTGFAMFFLMKAGQLAFGDPAAGASAQAGGLNPYALGFVAFISGFLCWQALERIEQAGDRFFASHKGKEHAPEVGRSLEKKVPEPPGKTWKGLASRLFRRVKRTSPTVN